MIIRKSPRRVPQVAYDTAQEAVPAYIRVNSPRSFTQPQFLAYLVLEEFLRLDYRGFARHLAEHAEMTTIVGLRRIPHFTTFPKAARRLLVAAPARRLFDAVLERALRDKVRKRRVPLAAVDGTEMESRHTSRYYVKRRSNRADQGERRAEVADGDGQLDDQAAARLRAAGADVLEPVPRDPPPGHHT